MSINPTSLYNLAADPGADIYYDDGFRATVEDHLQWLIVQPDTAQTTFSNDKANQYAGDFYGLLVDLHVPQYMHWITLRMNNLLNPSDFPVSMVQINLPGNTSLNKLRSMYSVFYTIS